MLSVNISYWTNVHALKSGKYDPEKTALIITQTGGGCRATNYVGFLKKGLREAGFPNVPIISLKYVRYGKATRIYDFI